MCESPCRDEYRAYAASARRFGTVGDNHGSLACAVLGHPRALAVRTIYKLGECAECIGDPRVAGLLLPLSVLGLVRGGRRPGGRSFMLVAFAGPALVLLVPPSVPMYFLIVLPPLLLAAALGTEGLLLHASNGARVAVAFALTIFGITWAGHYGWPGPSISPVLNRAARAIEERCRSGCLTNYLPPHVAAEAWVQLDAGASLPRHQATEESFVYGEVSPAFAAACRYKDRVARARAEGYFGPVLYLEVCTPTAHAFSDLGFDRGHDLEGPVDLSHAHLEAAFTEGLDTARLWSFPAGSLP